MFGYDIMLIAVYTPFDSIWYWISWTRANFWGLLLLPQPSTSPYTKDIWWWMKESRSQLQGLGKLAMCALPTELLRSLLQKNKGKVENLSAIYNQSINISNDLQIIPKSRNNHQNRLINAYNVVDISVGELLYKCPVRW